MEQIWKTSIIQVDIWEPQQFHAIATRANTVHAEFDAFVSKQCRNGMYGWYGWSKIFNFEWGCFDFEVQSIILLLERVSNLFVTRWLIYTEQDTLPVTYSWRSRICVCLKRTGYWNLSIVALLWRNDEVDGDRMWKGRNNLSLGDQWVVGLRLSSPSFNKLSRMRIIVTNFSFSWWTIFLLWRNLLVMERTACKG